MTVYFLFYAAVIGVSLMLNTVSKNKEKVNKIICIISFSLLVLIIGLRHPSMGNDLKYGMTHGYLGSFDIIGAMSWSSVLKIEKFLNYERGFVIFCKLVASIWYDQQFFLFVSAFISLFPIFLFAYKKSENIFMSLFIYTGVPAFLIIYSGIRQGIAIGLCFLALLFLKEEKNKVKDIVCFIIIVLLASTFHSSATVFILALPLYYLNLGKTSRWVSVAILFLIYICRLWIFNILSKIFKDDAVVEDTGAITLLLVFVGIYIICIMFSGTYDKEYNWYMNMFYIACVCQVFSGVYNTAMRIGYYFMIFLVVLLPKLVSQLKYNNDRFIFRIGVKLAFGTFALYCIYNSTWAMAYPYHFFWESI